MPALSGRALDRLGRPGAWVLLLLLCLGWNVLELSRRHTEVGKAWLVGWDDNFYLAWGRSLAVDGDWDFANDIGFAASLESLGAGARGFRAYLADVERTKAGRLPNKYACGIGILALPLLMAARLGLETLAFAGVTARPDPFSSLYVFAFVASGVLWGVIGLVAAHALLQREYSPHVVRWALLAGAIGLPLGYYIWFEPSMAHAAGFGVATLFVVCVRGWAERLTAAAPSVADWRRWAFLMGLVFGVACLVRFANLVLALVAVVMAWTLRSSSGPGGRSWLAVMIQSLGLVVVGTMIGFLPQLIAWKVVYGSYLVDTYTGERLTVWPSHLVAVLFGPRNGLFAWAPLALAAVAGLVVGARRSPMCRAGLCVLAATAWIYGGWETYWLGHSFGMRGFVDVSFFLLLGLAEIIRRAESLRPSFQPLRRAGQILLAFLLVWNLHLIVCYRALIQPRGEPLALRPILTEWKRWGHQVSKDTGLGTLTRLVARGSGQ